MKHKAKVLVIATSRQTRGGITSVVKAYEKSALWQDYHCKWIETHRDGNACVKLWYLLKGFSLFVWDVPRYGIVHIHTSEPPSALRKMMFVGVAKLFRRKVIVHFHSFSVDTTIKSKWQWVYRHLFGKAYRVLVLSNYWQDEICRTFGLGKDKVLVLYNPCITEVSNRYYQRKKEILYAGTVNARKGYADMIQAFSLIAARHGDWHIIFAGNGEIEEGKKLAEKCGIGAQTLFLGWIRGKDKDKAFKEATLFCLPSYAEGFPMGVLDAWAYGLPVITTPVGGIPDVAVDGRNCLLFTPGDVKGLAAQMERIIDDPNLRDAMARESLRLSQTLFSLENVTDELSRIYLELDKEHRSSINMQITPPPTVRKQVVINSLRLQLNHHAYERLAS